MKPMYQRKRGLLRAAAIVQVLIMAGAGCKSSTPKEGTGINDVSVSQALVGKDASRTVTAANTVINGYAALATDATAGATSIEVTDLDDFTVGTSARPALATGDLVLIIQMAGAEIDPNDTADYGTVTNLNSAGRYEFVGVTGVTAASDTISLSCGLKHSYSAAGKTQVVRVPQYTNLIINSGASITADAWDGTVGGVVAVHAMNTITLTGNINVSGKGFRGGRTHNSAGTMDDMVLFRTNVATQGAMKGEGIAGDPNDAAFTEKYGRGAPANAGGGGNWHNAGGGGGANASNVLIDEWTGEGVMLSSVVGGAAWSKETTTLANSPGGGRGGYAWSLNDENATDLGPNEAAWGGNNRRPHGGLGGHPLTSGTGGADPRLFMGGGGGAGDGNNSVAGAGGPGGGLVILLAGTVTGAGAINADGAKGGDATATGSSDAAGGGGGGGSIVVHAGVLSGIGVSAKGGVGGSQVFGGTPGNETEGPGGGGGGGFIALSGGTLSTDHAADGALGGTTNSAALTEFPSNGATAGHVGIANASAAALMYCTDNVAPDAIIMDPKPSNPSNSTNATFTFGATEANNGVDAGDNSASFVCSLDNAAFGPCPPTYIVTGLGEGTHTMRVRVVDLSGNDAGVGGEDIYTWRVDLIAPVPTIVTGPGGSASGGTSTSKTASFTLNATERDSGIEVITFQCRLDSNDPNGFTDCNETGTSTPTFPNLGEGTHTLDVRAKDDAGNVTDPDDVVRWTWTVHSLDAGNDSGEEDDDAGRADALVFTDASDIDAEIDTAGVVVLDASPDTTRDASGADRAVDTAARDTWVSLGDAAGDAGEGGVVLLDAASDVTDASPANDAKLDAVVPQDTAVAPSPDAYVPPADAAVNPSGQQDASTAPSGIKLMGGGFCSMNPAGSTPGLATLFLVAVFGLMIVRRRRR
jgi:hypothetical protein